MAKSSVLFVVILVLMLAGCGIMDAVERVTELEGEIQELGAEISEMAEGPEKESALESLAVLESDLASARRSLQPVDLGLKLAGWVLAVLLGTTGLARVRKYNNLAGFLVKKIEIISSAQERKQIYNDAQVENVEELLAPIVRKVT